MSEHSDTDSDAPDDVTFSTSRSSVLEEQKAAKLQISESKKKLKDRRRQMDEKYKEQKMKKLEELEKTKLSDEILAGLPDEPVKKKVKKSGQPNVKVKVIEDILDDDGADDEACGLTDQELSDDFIALNKSSGIQVMPISEMVRQGQTSAERAAAFKQKMMFGSRVNRESVKAKMAKKTKRMARLR